MSLNEFGKAAEQYSQRELQLTMDKYSREIGNAINSGINGIVDIIGGIVKNPLTRLSANAILLLGLAANSFRPMSSASALEVSQDFSKSTIGLASSISPEFAGVGPETISPGLATLGPDQQAALQIAADMGRSDHLGMRFVTDFAADTAAREIMKEIFPNDDMIVKVIGVTGSGRMDNGHFSMEHDELLNREDKIMLAVDKQQDKAFAIFHFDQNNQQLSAFRDLPADLQSREWAVIPLSTNDGRTFTWKSGQETMFQVDKNGEVVWEVNDQTVVCAPAKGVDSTISVSPSQGNQGEVVIGTPEVIPESAKLMFEWTDKPETIQTIPVSTPEQFMQMIQDAMKGKPETDTSGMILVEGFKLESVTAGGGGTGNGLFPVIFDKSGKPLDVARGAGLTQISQYPIVDTVMALMEDPTMPGGKSLVFSWGTPTKFGIIRQFARTDGRLVTNPDWWAARKDVIGACMFNHDVAIAFNKEPINPVPVVIADLFNMVSDSFGAEAATQVGMTKDGRVALDAMGKEINLLEINSPQAKDQVQKAMMKEWAPIWCGSIEPSK